LATSLQDEKSVAGEPASVVRDGGHYNDFLAGFDPEAPVGDGDSHPVIARAGLQTRR